MDQHGGFFRRIKHDGHHLTIALAGNANVGKSVVFNQLTGMHQHVGNWPGKTVKRAEGTLIFSGYTIDIVDLPGIYSLSTFSLEEMVSREYIALENPDVLINVVDSSALERNLFFTIQLLELEPNLIMALNQIDVAEKKGIVIDHNKLSQILGVPVVPMTATKNIGLKELMDEVIEITEKDSPLAKPLKFGSEIEEVINKISKELENYDFSYPKRWLAIKLLESDEEIEYLCYSKIPELSDIVSKYKNNIETLHGHDAASVIASERYALASSIAANVSSYKDPQINIWKRLEDLTTHPIYGYLIMLMVVLGMFFTIFSFGDYLIEILESHFEVLNNIYYSIFGEGTFQNFIWEGLIEGIIAGITIALPYIVPFFLALSLLEDTGYLARVAFLMDSLMHKIGLHGKGFIPVMLGFGCNVPACLGCSIMETERERLICAFVTSLVPCAARSIVIMGLVATYLGFEWAVLLYILDFLLIFFLGRIAFKVMPGEPIGLIMEMPSYKNPSGKVTFHRTWFKLKSFVYEAFPIMIIGNLVIYLANSIGLINVVEELFSPITVGWLGLPTAAGVVLIFGILRKELALILFASLLGTTNFATILTPVQMFVFAFVVMIYIPCIATISVLAKEFGAKAALTISIIEITLAVILGGLVNKILIFLKLI